jgi:hypothetical protein
MSLIFLLYNSMSHLKYQLFSMFLSQDIEDMRNI